MYNTRPLNDSDLTFIQERDFLLWLQIQYDGDFDRSNAVAVTGEDGGIVAAAALEYQSSWYAECRENLVQLNYCYKDSEALPVLVNAAVGITARLASENPKKNVTLIAYGVDNDREEIQRLLHCGFCFGEVIPVLAYDLNNPYEEEAVPEGVTFRRVEDTDEAIKEYLSATGLANDGVADAYACYRFRNGGESFCSIRAEKDGRTIGGISVWDIGDDGGATENIFTVPEFRNKGIATALIYKAFDELKSRGKKTATLSMLGGNAAAMKLYQSLGYKLSFFMYQLKYKA